MATQARFSFFKALLYNHTVVFLYNSYICMQRPYFYVIVLSHVESLISLKELVILLVLVEDLKQRFCVFFFFFWINLLLSLCVPLSFSQSLYV